MKDYFNFLFKSAAENHLRKQHCVKNSDGTYVCTMSFPSYSALKRYQKSVRRITVSLSTVIILVVIAFIVGYSF